MPAACRAPSGASRPYFCVRGELLVNHDRPNQARAAFAQVLRADAAPGWMQRGSRYGQALSYLTSDDETEQGQARQVLAELEGGEATSEALGQAADSTAAPLRAEERPSVSIAEALAAQPQEAPLALLQARALEQLGQTDEAQAVLEVFLAKQPAHPRAPLAQVLLERLRQADLADDEASRALDETDASIEE